MTDRLSNRDQRIVERARAFDDFASRFTGLYELGIALHPLWGPRLRRALAQIRGPRVLEVAFGTGYLMSLYADRFDVTGLDYNPRMLASAERLLARKGVRATLVQGDVHNMPFADATFDCVVNTDAFTLFPDSRQAMSELHRVLVPGGRLVLLEWDRPKDGNWLGSLLVRMWKAWGLPYVAFDPLFKSVGFEYEDHALGMFGVLHMFVATKALQLPLTATETSSATP